MTRLRLSLVATAGLLATALLGLAVAHGFEAQRWEQNALRLLGHPPDVARWADLADFLAVPVITIVLLISLVFGALTGVFWRVVALAGTAAVALLVNEWIVKPLVQERFQTQLSFPSGHVTAICATALAMWVALYPVLRPWSRAVALLLAAGWTLLMSMAVVGAFWHTPLDCLGSVCLSVGIVAGGAAIVGPKRSPQVVIPAEPVPVMERV